jgi:TonB family protein
MTYLRPWQVSFIAHSATAAVFLFLLKMPMPDSSFIEVPIEISPPKEVQKIVPVEEKPKVVIKSVNEVIPEARPSKAVFGANRNSYVDESVSDSEAVESKKGNTLAKSTDQEVLQDSDSDALPTPTEEYLVSEMPSVLSEVRPHYPKAAQDQRLDGAVVMDILIDELGAVREATLVDGPEIFRSGALEAMKKFKFRPAQVDGNPVAVKIRYTLRFELEY